jgi:hypothetical protein
LPAREFDGCVTRPVALTPYSQVVFATNRYAVPADSPSPPLVLKASPSRVDILHLDRVLARHPRCYGRAQASFDPWSDLPLQEQRPGAVDHAKPLRRWRERWPPIDEQLVARLRADARDGHGVREFVRLLRVPREHPAEPIRMLGTPGLGNTQVVTGSALAAYRQGDNVRFYTAAGLVNEVLQAQDDHRLSRVLAAALNHQLLVLDEPGFIPFSPPRGASEVSVLLVRV